ncbi:MAG: His/Gly/Thr/Pro-type tRNA ligase C-terminal domain-containing protein, partial [Nanoarchaeota archaeon]|nr:His/Gly/Thr/Pro-type tRNA ligase C-terminal domain-containing protein [Nanoarchaeota archaeon]
CIPFAQKVVAQLHEQRIRVELNADAETVGKKVHDAQAEKVNYIVTIGDKEVEKKTIAIRSRDGKVKFDVPLKTFIEELKEEIESRK